MILIIDTDEINDILIYHCRIDAAQCRECGEMPLGSSFTQHQVDEIIKRGKVVKP